jgi:hypothetical protein
VVGEAGAVVAWLVAWLVAIGIGGVIGSGALVRGSATVAASAAVALGNVVVLDEPHAASMSEVAMTANVELYKLGIVLSSPL